MKKMIIIPYLYCFFVSFLFLIITSKLSPIYPINDWCDTNCFFTIGKSIMNGFIVYKDLFEQKGPILYLIYGLGYLISHKSFFGVFIFETISFSVFLKYCFDILMILKCNNKKYILLVLSFIMTTSISFYGGGSAEEFCLPFIAYNLKQLIKIYNGDVKNKDLFLNGFFCGIVFLIKFNLVSFWIFFVLLLLFKKYFSKFFFFVLGFFSIVFFIFLYFYIKNDLYYFIDIYFIKNIFNYNNFSNYNKFFIFNFFDKFFDGIFNIFYKNHFLLFSLLFCIIYFYKLKKINIFLYMFIFPFIFICCQNVWFEYYAFPFFVFSLFGIILIFNNIVLKRFVFYIFVFLIVIFAFLFGKNTFMLKYSKEDYVQYKFGEIINSYEDKTILNYGFIDSGFYLATDTFPNVRFFHTMNFSNFSEMYDAQNYYIENKMTNFVICVSPEENFVCSNDLVNKKYKLIASERHNVDYGLYYNLYVRK